MQTSEEENYVSRLEILYTLRSLRFGGTRRFQVQGKLAPRYIGPYQVVKRVGALAYHIQLPEEMSDIHLVFHVS